MFRTALTAVVMMFLGASVLPADFSYQETSAVTGGMIASVMKVAGFFSKSAKEPIVNNVSVKGDKMVTRNQNTATVIDLASQTFTTIDFQKKTYSVMTFEEMKKALEEAMKKANKDGSTDMEFKVSVDNTGNTKQIAGFEAKEMVLKMEMQGKDRKTGDSGAMVITTNMWIAPVAQGYAEVRDFQRRMAEKINWTPSGNMFMAQPEVAKGMAGVAKEMSKLDGMPVQQFITMAAAGQPGAQQPGATAEAPPAQQEEQKAERPSVGGALGRLGGFGGFGRKKAPPKEEQPKQQSSGTPGSLIEMKMEMSGFSSAPVDDSQFAVPGGFKKVDAKM